MARHYLFADESGNLDFSRNRGATRYFAVGTLHVVGDDALDALRLNLLRLQTELAWRGVHDCGAFHASEDRQVVRDAVYALLRRHPVYGDVTWFEKSKVPPLLHHDPVAFFAYAWSAHALPLLPALAAEELMVSVAAVGTRRLRAALRGALSAELQGRCAAPTVVFAPAASDPALQAADYLLWAVMRSIEGGDPRALDPMRRQMRSQRAFPAGALDHY